MRDLRGGVIGCGFFARNHLHAWREVEGMQVAAVCDVDADRANAFAREFGVGGAYTDADEMLRKEKLDFVDIVTQPAAHRPLVELAARRGTHVICQKPLANSLEDARAMVGACQSAGVRFMVHENFRWQAPIRAVKEAAGDLGELFFGRITFRTPYDVYANQPYLAQDPRFIVADVGVHLLDLARFFLGEAERLYCQTRRINPRIEGEDTATILLRMRNGATCVVELSYFSKLEEDLFPQTLVHLEGTRGTVLLGPHYRRHGPEASGSSHGGAPMPPERPPARHPERRGGDPAALGGVPARRAGAGDLRRGQRADPGTGLRRLRLGGDRRAVQGGRTGRQVTWATCSSHSTAMTSPAPPTRWRR